MNIIARYMVISFHKYFINRLNGFMVVIDTIFSCGSIWLFWYSLMELDIYTAGWDYSTLQLFVGFSILSKAFVNLTVGDYDIQKRITDGSLDMILVKPCNPILLIMVERPDFLQFIVTFMIGIVYITINAKGLNPLHLLLAIVVCVISTFLVYLWGVFIFILTFWFKKMESTADLFYTIAAVSKYPLIFLPKQILLSFTYVIPIAFMGTIPAEIANGKIDFLELAWLPLLVVVTLLLISICWKLGRNRYESIN